MNAAVYGGGIRFQYCDAGKAGRFEAKNVEFKRRKWTLELSMGIEVWDWNLELKIGDFWMPSN